MRLRYPLFILLFFVSSELVAQKTDSIKYQNGFLYYHEYGQGEAIVLLSGGPGNSAFQLAEMATVLAKKYRVLLLEQRGTGRSIPTPFDSTTINLTTAVSDLKLLLDRLTLRQAIICGHSWGGSLALYFARAYPARVKSLVLIDPGFFSLGAELTTDFFNNRAARWSLSDKRLIDSLTIKRDNKTITAEELYALKYTLRLPYVSKKERLDSLYKKFDVPVNGYTSAQLTKEAGRNTVDLRQSLKRFRKPVSLICGSQDFLAYISYELKIMYPRYDLYWIRDSGHFPMYEQPGPFYSVLETVINRAK